MFYTVFVNMLTFYGARSQISDITFHSIETDILYNIISKFNLAFNSIKSVFLYVGTVSISQTIIMVSFLA